MKTLTAALMAVAACHAGTINFGTAVGLPEGNSLTGTNVITIPDQVYHAPLGASLWESTQADSTSPLIPNGTTVGFWFTFTLAGMPLSGTLGVLVDDSARGYLNGQYIFDNLASPQGGNCAASQPNCLTPLEMDISAYLMPGENYLEVLVSQDGGGPFALDVYGSADYLDAVPPPPEQPTESPEPASMALIGGGLMMMGAWRRRR